MAAAIYEPPPDAEKLASFGLRPEDLASDNAVEVWPDNLDAANVFIAMSTQWRIGHGGAYGLDYSALSQVWKLVGIRKRDRPSVFDDIRVMEDAALEQMRKK